MKYGELIAYCEDIDGNCFKCNKLSDCKSLRHGMDLNEVKPCDISRLWNEEIHEFDDLAYRRKVERERKRKHANGIQ